MDISKILSQYSLTTGNTKPRYLQISDTINNLLQSQVIAAGTKLPPERELASLFGVSRTTAINAYRFLEQKGIVESKVGSGTYIARHLPSPTAAGAGLPWSQLVLPTLSTPTVSILRDLVSTPMSEETISLAAGMPAPDLYPVETFNRLFLESARSLPSKALGYIPTEGYPELREAIADILKDKGLLSTAATTMVVSGSQQGLYLLTKVFISPGDYIITQSPTYLGAIQAFQAAGARILGFPASEPLPLELLEDYMIRYRPKLIYILPTFQNPTGHVLTAEERRQLIKLAAKHRIAIIEDDTYGELYYKETPPPPLKAFDNYGGVIYLGTASKIIFPGLRAGWVVAPAEVIHRLAMEKQYVDLHSANLSQWLLYLFLKEGLLPSHTDFIRSVYKKRRDAAVSAIRRYCGDNIFAATPDGGFYLWCKIEQPVSARSLLHETTKFGVSFVPGEAFYADANGQNEFRLCFATHNEDAIAEGIKRIAKCLAACMKNNYSINKAGSSWQPII